MTISLDDEIKRQLQDALIRYLHDELDMEIKGFDAEFLLDFIVEKMGPQFYNQGLRDARAMLENRVTEIGEAIEELEQY